MVYDEGRGVLVDSGVNTLPQRVIDFLGEYSIALDLLINTHLHFDHVAGNRFIVDETGCGVALHERDAALLASHSEHSLAGLFSSSLPEFSVDQTLSDGQVVEAGFVKLQVIHSPGHTPGSICLYEPESRSLFTGDTVFADGVGRTDFPGGSLEDLKHSVERLLDYQDKADKIYPAHGPIGDSLCIEKVFQHISSE